MTILADVSNPRCLQPLNQFRRAFPNEKGDEGSDSNKDSDSDKDDDVDVMMGDTDEEPTPIHESTRLGQTDDSSYSYQLSDDESSIPNPNNSTKQDGAEKSEKQQPEASTSKSSNKANCKSPLRLVWVMRTYKRGNILYSYFINSISAVKGGPSH